MTHTAGAGVAAVLSSVSAKSHFVHASVHEVFLPFRLRGGVQGRGRRDSRVGRLFRFQNALAAATAARRLPAVGDVDALGALRQPFGQTVQSLDGGR